MLGANSVLRRVHHKIFQAPKGYGETLPPEYFDRQYFDGVLDFLDSTEEFANHMVTAGYVRQFAKTVNGRAKVLDIGCGEGLFAEITTGLADVDYYGLDISQEAVRRAELRTVKSAEFVVGNAETFLTDQRFDVIVSAGAIHHFNDAVALLKHHSRFLNPGGVFVVSLWRYGHNGKIWQRLEQEFDLVDSTLVTNHKGQSWDVKVLRPR